jgi:hypothetical protein
MLSTGFQTLSCSRSAATYSLLHVALQMQVEGRKEVEAWAVALCLMHPLDPSKGCSPTSLLSISIVKDLLMLADKYNMQVQGGGVQGKWGHVGSSLKGAG